MRPNNPKNQLDVKLDFVKKLVKGITTDDLFMAFARRMRDIANAKDNRCLTCGWYRGHDKKGCKAYRMIIPNCKNQKTQAEVKETEKSIEQYLYDSEYGWRENE